MWLPRLVTAAAVGCVLRCDDDDDELRSPVAYGAEGGQRFSCFNFFFRAGCIIWPRRIIDYAVWQRSGVCGGRGGGGRMRDAVRRRRRRVAVAGCVRASGQAVIFAF